MRCKMVIMLSTLYVWSQILLLLTTLFQELLDETGESRSRQKLGEAGSAKAAREKRAAQQGSGLSITLTYFFNYFSERFRSNSIDLRNVSRSFEMIVEFDWAQSQCQVQSLSCFEK